MNLYIVATGQQNAPRFGRRKRQVYTFVLQEVDVSVPFGCSHEQLLEAVANAVLGKKAHPMSHAVAAKTAQP